MEFKPTAAAPLCAGPDPRPRKPSFTLPPGATDTHFHIFGPMTQYGFSQKRIYTPPDALLADWQRLADTLGVERGVIVQPSVYGADNSVTLANLKAMNGKWRAVVVVEDSITDKRLEAMHALGVRGIRFNVVDVAAEQGVLPMKRVRHIAERIAPLGWHVQFLMHVDDYPDLEKMFDGFPTDIVIDHFGYMKAAKGTQHPNFQAFLRLMKGGRCWCKFTGAYRISAHDMPYPDVTPLAHAIIEANPDRVVWGSDWPHAKHDGAMPNDGEMCDRLLEWVPDTVIRNKVLAANPATLYGF
jgi:predicted TIM-barrel fold metal-dependent hydrolase